jgi:transcription antitermination factor NusG
MGDAVSQPRWYALYVRSHHEKHVFAELSTKQYEVFLPLYYARHRWADRWKTLLLPLFPSYVFCHFDFTQRTPVVSTPGVIELVRFGNEPAPVENTEIDAIRKIANSRLSTEPYAGLVRGQRVMMIKGPLNGLTGTLTEIHKKLRLVLSVALLNRSVLVEIEQDWVVPCEQPTMICNATAPATAQPRR